jgi:hypothetical protein
MELEEPAANIVLKRKYSGSLESLKNRLRPLGLEGEWKITNPKVWRLRTADGVGLHWAKSTGTIWFDGPPQPKAKLADAVHRLLCGESTTHRLPLE